MAFKGFISRVTSSFKLCRSKHPSNIPHNPIQLSPSPLFVDSQPATPLPFKKPHRSFKHRVSSFLVCGLRTHEDNLPESPPSPPSPATTNSSLLLLRRHNSLSPLPSPAIPKTRSSLLLLLRRRHDSLSPLPWPTVVSVVTRVTMKKKRP
ncbi:hypothetical protein CsSME_00047029 [Camellia sinensis var. sinensis]